MVSSTPSAMIFPDESFFKHCEYYSGHFWRHLTFWDFLDFLDFRTFGISAGRSKSRPDVRKNDNYILPVGVQKWASRICRRSQTRFAKYENSYSEVNNIKKYIKAAKNDQKIFPTFSNKNTKKIRFGKTYQKSLFFTWLFIVDGQKTI